VAHRNAGQQIKGCVVVDRIASDHAAMTVVGVLAQADVGDHHQIGHLVFDGFYSSLHDAVFGIGLRAQSILALWDTEQNDGWYAKFAGLFGRFDDVIDRQLRMTRHGGDRIFHIFAVDGKQRQDQVVYMQSGLADHAADGFISAHSSRSIVREQH